jgi:hypothetical protein
MRDRPSPSNGKRDAFWGTLRLCPECGLCLCYGCHPQGPCRDERDALWQPARAAANPETPFSARVNARSPSVASVSG